MIIPANSVEELIVNSHNPQLFIEIYQFINEKLHGEGVLYKEHAQAKTVIGYYIVAKSSEDSLGHPLISIIPQVDNICLKLAIINGDSDLILNYASIFGVSNCDYQSIKISSMNSLRYQALEQILKEAHRQIIMK